MPRVFILGAGSSGDLRFNFTEYDVSKAKKYPYDLKGPLSTGLCYSANQICQKINKHNNLSQIPRMGKHLISWIQDKYGLSEKEIISNENKSARINIETIYRQIEEEWKKEPHQKIKSGRDLIKSREYHLYFALDELNKYIFNVFSNISYYCVSTVHNRFAEILQPGDIVISFNWEILLEEALVRAGKFDYSEGYGLEVSGFIPSGESPSPVKFIVPVLKPHASINWYRTKRGNTYIGLQPKIHLRGGLVRPLRQSYKVEGEWVRSSFVTPGHKRKIFPEVWKKIRLALESATEIIAIGFAFNDNDVHVRQEIQGMNLQDKIKITVVDPRVDKMNSIFQDVFPNTVIYPINSSFSSWLEKNNAK